MAAETTTHTASVEHPAEAHHVDPAALGMNATAWVSLAMLAVIAIMIWKKVPSAIGGSLDRKIDTIRRQLDEAATLRAEAETLKAEYEAKAKAATRDARDILVHAEREAAAIIAKAETDAAALVERRTRMAKDKIAAAERAAIDEVRAKAASTAAAAAALLIAEAHDAKADKTIVDETIAGLRLN